MQNRTFFLLEPWEAYDPFSTSVHRCLLAREHLLDSRTPATFQGWSLGMGSRQLFLPVTMAHLPFLTFQERLSVSLWKEPGQLENRPAIELALRTCPDVLAGWTVVLG